MGSNDRTMTLRPRKSPCQPHLWMLLASVVLVAVSLSQMRCSAGDIFDNRLYPIFDTLGGQQQKISPFDGPDTLSCRVIEQRQANGTWHDPNKGEIYARRLVTDPAYTVSLHREDYDRLRWRTVFQYGKYYEHQVRMRFNTILKETPKDAVVLDVGTNIGIYTLQSATLGRHVLSFEINPANLMRLCESLAFNRLEDRVTILQRGVSNVDDQVLEVVVPFNPGQAKMQAVSNPSDGASQSSDSILTTTVTLDTLAKQQGWLEDEDFQIALLKVDVEGHEPQIVQGSPKLLSSGKVLNILTEFRRLGRPAAQQALKVILDSGFTLVDDKRGKMTIKETIEKLQTIRERLKDTEKTIDLWFQWTNTSDPV